MRLTKGTTALITGASSGIGEALSHAFASQGVNLALVARREARLESIAAALRQRHGVRVEVVGADLAVSGAATGVAQAMAQRGLDIDILVNNAGFATHGHFETIDTSRDQDQIQVDVAAVVALTHAFVPAMLARRQGAIINVASTAAFQPVPYMSVYSASKAFVLTFSRALAVELRPKGVHVLALCPGPTDTEFFAIAGEDASFGRKRTAEQVVVTTLRALAHDRGVAIDGRANALMAQLSRVMPPSLVARFAAAAARPSDPASRPSSGG